MQLHETATTSMNDKSSHYQINQTDYPTIPQRKPNPLT